MQPVAHPAPEAEAERVPLWKTLRKLYTRRAPSKTSYPPISSIPRTSAARIQQASPPDIPDGPVAAASLSGHDNDADTVLYLAYGSNLAAATFLG
ncbi:gliotoxin biosynthesis protein GliK, partial [Magnaporthiopsis poae ATCC 64411]